MKAKTALIIDDDAELCDELAEMLRDEGFRVKVAPDAFSGLALLTLGGYHIAVLDFKMPGMNGVELLKKARGSGTRTAVFMVSGKQFLEQQLQEEGLSGLVSGVLSKPFNPEVLLAKIRAVDARKPV